jgi:hypothetical protein
MVTSKGRSGTSASCTPMMLRALPDGGAAVVSTVCALRPSRR